MKNNPLISVIIPAYNVESFILNCIDSIYSQKPEDIEVIIIEDGSKDNTLKIIKSVEAKYNNFIVLKQSNAGVSAARNFGLSQAKGEYVYFLDSDDWLEPTFFKEVSFVCKHINPDCIIFGYKKTNAKGDFIVSRNPFFTGLINKEEEQKALAELFVKDNGLAVWDKIIRRSIIIDNNLKFQEMRNAEDFVFSLDCFLHATTIYVIENALYNYRIQISGKRSDNYKVVTNQIIAFKKINVYFDFLNNQSIEVQSFGKKIFIKWFGLVAPLNIVSFKKITFKEKMTLLEEQKKDLVLKKLINKFTLKNLSWSNKFLLIIIKSQSTILLYLIGLLLTKARKIYFKSSN